MHIKQLTDEALAEVQENEENARKKFKQLEVEEIKAEIVIKPPPMKSERCNICRQYIDEVRLYNGHPNNSVEEYITLTNEQLSLFTGDDADVNQQDVRPTLKITHFSVYDKNGHLCPFDGGLIEGNKLLYFSGYVNPIYDEDTTINNGIPTKDMWPINEWFIAGFDGGKNALVAFSTEYDEYYLQEPSLEYQPIVNAAVKKIHVTKIVIEFLSDEAWQNPTYEDLLQKLKATGDPEITEETLLKHAQFICEQVASYDTSSNNDEELQITAPCMRALVKMAGVTFQQRQKMRKLENKTNPILTGLPHERKTCPVDLFEREEETLMIRCALESCPKQFPGYTEMHMHLLDHVPFYVCTSCWKALETPKYLYLHELIHMCQRTFQCPFDLCGKFFTYVLI